MRKAATPTGGIPGLRSDARTRARARWCQAIQADPMTAERHLAFVTGRVALHLPSRYQDSPPSATSFDTADLGLGWAGSRRDVGGEKVWMTWVGMGMWT